MSIIRTGYLVSRLQTVCAIDFAERFHYTIVEATSDSGQALYEATGELDLEGSDRPEAHANGPSSERWPHANLSCEHRERPPEAAFTYSVWFCSRFRRGARRSLAEAD